MNINELELEDRKRYKQCRKCFCIKHLNEFYRNPQGNRGTYGHCRECVRKEYKTKIIVSRGTLK